MSRWWLTSIAALALVAAPPAIAQTQNDTTKPGATKPGSEAKLTAQMFVARALESGQKEMAAAQLAVQKAASAELKQFADKLASDHKAVNEQLQILARDDKTGAAPKGQSDSTKPGTGQASPPSAAAPGAAPSASAEMTRLQGLSGSAFDKAFLDMIVQGHEKSVELYEDASETLPEGAAKKLAADTLPKIKDHLQQAKSLQQQITDKKNR